jgi:hypothetical protein
MSQTAEHQYVLCLRNDECDDLELRKIYRLLKDKEAEKDGYLRVVDESGEDYLYPESYFVIVTLPKTACDFLATSAR